MFRLARLTAILSLSVLLSVAGVPAASAHTTLVAADPVENSSLTTGPDHVSATFSEELQSGFAAMTVVGPDGTLWSTGTPEVHGAVVRTAVRPLGPVGIYTVNYRVTSADGHVVSGAWSFHLTQTGTGDPGPAPTAPVADSAVPGWPFLAAAVILIGAGAVWAVRRRR